VRHHPDQKAAYCKIEQKTKKEKIIRYERKIFQPELFSIQGGPPEKARSSHQ